jgi:hypothetical protein
MKKRKVKAKLITDKVLEHIRHLPPEQVFDAVKQYFLEQLPATKRGPRNDPAREEVFREKLRSLTTLVLRQKIERLDRDGEITRRMQELARL